MSDFYWVEADEPDDAARKIIELTRSRIPERFGLDPIREVQVLCPMNRGRLGARALNLARPPHFLGRFTRFCAEPFKKQFECPRKRRNRIPDCSPKSWGFELQTFVRCSIATRLSALA